MFSSSEIRQKYLDFFKGRGHAIAPSVSLIPENDPTTLFTGSGMQPMMPYLLGQNHPLGKRIANSQRCLRTQDIEEVGDSRHTTFFEMLGNWSFGDYFKKEQIGWIFSFLADELGLDPSRLYVTCFRGNKQLPRDEEAVLIWREEFEKRGIKAETADFPEKKGMRGARIFYYDETKNWWSRAGLPQDMPEGEPGGPDSEIFWDFGENLGIHEKSSFGDKLCHPNCDCGRFLEIGNNVFMTYKKKRGAFVRLSQSNIDFGGGLERISQVLQNCPDIFKTDLFLPLIKEMEALAGKLYDQDEKTTRSFRVVADHLRAAIFLISDGALPSNKDQGYFTRRLVRRAVRYGQALGIRNFLGEVAPKIFEKYPEFQFEKVKIKSELSGEEKIFGSTLSEGLKAFENIARGRKKISGEESFLLFQSYGFPIEMTQELARERGISLDRKGFEASFKKHRDVSRQGAEKKFKGGLEDHSKRTIRMHTATHLLGEALRRVVSPDIKQKGSNITAERLRFDFNFSRKLAKDEISAVEEKVNGIIKDDLPVVRKEMSLKEALESGAQAEFGAKYPNAVSVYSIGEFSKEICGGPHVKKTSEIGKLMIIKEESAGSGIRRIRARVSP